MGWTTPEDIRAAVQRHWDRGHLLSLPAGDPLFPLEPRFSRPDARALSERFDDVRAWIRALEAESRSHRGTGYEIRWLDVNHRQLGANRVPAGVIVPTLDDALALIGKRRAAERYRALLEETRESCPPLVSWVQRRPLAALSHADDWKPLLSTVKWFRAQPRPGVYLRQIDLPGVDTKFIETRRSLVAELLDEVLPPEAVDRAAPATRLFEQRYGLAGKPALVRFRLLDARLFIRGLADIATPAVQFAALDLPVRRVFVSENEVNGLAFPAVPDSLIVFGLGYGLDRLAAVPWFRDKDVHYWGDIDTHGFAMLDRLRAALPHVRSLLMDRETLLAHRSHWVQEPEPHTGSVDRLTAPERSLVEDLRHDRLGQRVRLEQERVRFSWLLRALSQAGVRSDSSS